MISKNIKYLLSQEICNKIINDNKFSLKLALYMNLSQQSVIKHAKSRNECLVNATQIEFFKKEGYSYEEIVSAEN